MARKTEKEKAPRAKAPDKTLEARFNGKLTKGFTDLRDIVLSVVNRPDDDPENLDYDIFLPDYKEKFGMKFDRNVYQKIQSEVRRQMKYDTLLTTISERGNEVDFFPFQEIEWCGNGMIHVVLGRRFKKILAEKGNPYTIYSIAYTLPMKSKYSKVMFPRLMEHLWQSRMRFNYRGDQRDNSFTYFETINQFREICGIPESYNTAKVKQVCATIVNDIADYTDYTAEVFFNSAQVPGSTSKKPMVTHVCWNLIRKSGEVIDGADYEVQPEQDQIPDQISLDDYPVQDEIRKITGADEKSAMSIISNARRKGIENSRILEICREVMKKPNVENPAAYINWVINGGRLSDQGTEAKTKFNGFNQRTYTEEEWKAIQNKMMK